VDFSSKENIQLKIPTSKSAVLFAALAIMVFLRVPVLFGDDFGAVWGKALSAESLPITGADVRISSYAEDRDIRVSTDSSGYFHIPGLPSGRYTLQMEPQGYKPLFRDDLFVLPGQTLFIRAVLISEGTPGRESMAGLLRLDYSQSSQQTLINEHQSQGTPSAHNIWFLIENQDLSATTNRIDIGGLWGNIPALFSARGGVSWTQSAYLLNGLDVTDPYDTGRPLFFPDFFAIRSIQLSNAAHPPYAVSPGGYLNLMTQRESSELHGGVSAFYVPNALQSSNITTSLRGEGIEEANAFDYLIEGNAHLSGPLLNQKLSFFASVSANDLSRDMAEFDAMDKSRMISGLLSFRYRLSGGDLRLLWTGQSVASPAYGAGRKIPFMTTSDRDDRFHVLQALWSTRIGGDHFLEAGVNFAYGHLQSRFQEDATGAYSLTLFGGNPSGTAPLAFDDTRKSLAFCVKGDSFLGELLAAQHRLRYGLQLQYARSSSFKIIYDNLHLHFFKENALEIVQFNTPLEHGEAGLSLNLYMQDSFTFSNFLSLYVGVNCDYSRGWVPGQAADSSGAENSIQWINLSPRVGIIIPLSPTKNAALKLSFARYFFRLPLSFLTYGNTEGLGGLAYRWNDKNGDRQFQENERGVLIRREGPLYSKIDSELQRPYTQEFNIVYSVVFGADWSFSLGGFYRETRNQVKALNTGVPLTAYEPEYLFDLGDDYLAFTPDDQVFTVFNQNEDTLGKDFFLLSNVSGDRRTTHYFGADINLVKRFSENFSFFFSFTATLAEGTTNPGDSEYENDDGMIGSLYDSPNTLINAKGRVRWDRAYTARLGLTHRAPFGLKMGYVVKYYDGQPFARKIIVEGFNQGPFYIQAHSRGAVRFEYNLNLDVRIEKALELGKGRFRFILDGFNLLNMGLATAENAWDGPEFKLRYATEIQSPRVFRLGLAYDF